MKRLRFWHGYSRDAPGLFEPWWREMWDLARDGDWQKVFSTLPRDSEYSPPGISQYAGAICPYHETNYSLLHFAAEQGASPAVVERLLEMGAWRSLQDARGQRPIEVARKHDRRELYDLLKPQFKRDVPFAVLLEMQHHFHSAIRRWDGGSALGKHEMMLPQLQPMLEVARIEFRFPVAHWKGAFDYDLVSEGEDAKLECFGSRASSGSGARVEITRRGVKDIPLKGIPPP